MRWYQLVFTAGALFIACAGPVACNTVEGVARDVEALGRGMGDAASDTNPYRDRYR